MSYYGFRPYVPVAKRRLLAARELEKLKKKGHIVSPVVIEGRTNRAEFLEQGLVRESGALF
jgi:hypothetical protein